MKLYISAFVWKIIIQGSKINFLYYIIYSEEMASDAGFSSYS